MPAILTYFGNAFNAGGWIATFLICMILVWKASAKYKHINTQVEEIPGIKNDITIIKKDVAEIKGSLLAFMRDKETPDASQSPIRLSDYGREIFDAIEGAKLVKKYASKVEFPEHLNAYQIQEACRSYALTEFMDDLDPDERERIELYAYNTGDPIEFPLRVMWISMRDHWLKEKNIPTDDVDNHASEDA